MNSIVVKIATLVVKTLDISTFFLKSKKNKVVYISYRDNNLPKDMISISNSLKEINPNVIEVYLPMKYKNTFLDKIKYVFEIIKQVYHIKTSSIVLIDGNNFVISNINTKDTKVIQIWHATGAIKKFGNDYKRKYSIKNYDYVITASSTSIDNMSKAFGINKENVLALGSALTDDLFNLELMNEYNSEMINKYPQIKGKKVILYAPTFRGDAVYENNYNSLINLPNVAKSLGSEYILLCKMHPILSKQEIGQAENLINVSNESIDRLFSVSDVLISDFSSIIFDYTILEKPIILYTPDLKEYKIERGLYYNYEEFAPGKIAYNEEELVNTIKNSDFKLDKVLKLKNNFFDYKDSNSSKRIADFINNLL